MKKVQMYVACLVVIVGCNVGNPRGAEAQIGQVVVEGLIWTAKVAVAAGIFLGVTKGVGLAEDAFERNDNIKHFLNNPSEWCADRNQYKWQDREVIDKALREKYGQAEEFCSK